MNNTSLKNWCVAFAMAVCAPMAAVASPSESALPQAQQANGKCTGTIVDETGEPLVGATVRVEGTTIAASANIDGEFTLSGVKPGQKIVANYIGYNPVTIVWDGAPLNIVMKEDSNVLDEVVVMGYGVSQKRAKVTNSIAKVSEKTLTVGTNANPAQALVGAISGVKVAVTSGDPAATPSITVRGGTNYDGGSNAPLVIVDGNIRDSMSDINPNDIESMEILKDAGATALYGARAGNGVILITTKAGKSGTGRVTLSAKVGLGYYNNGYEACTDEDYLYYYRTACTNTEWMLPGGNYAGYWNSMLFSNNQPGGIGRQEWSNNMNYNILQKNEKTEYLLGLGGWKEMLDPVSDNTILYWNQDILDINLRKPTVTQDYNVSFSGGNDRGSYYASLGYYDAQGVVKTTYYKRYNFAFTGSYKLNDWLTANSVFNYTRANWLNDNPQLSTVYFMNRGFGYKFVRYRDEEGNELFGTGNPTMNVNVNKGKFDRDYQSDKFSMTQSLTAKIIDGLTLKGTMAWYYNEQYTQALNHAYVTNNTGADNPEGSVGVSSNYSTSASFLRYFDQTYNLVANFNRTFAEKHNVEAMAGMEFYKRKYLDFSASGYDGPAPFPVLGNTTQESRDMSSNHAEEALMSYFGRVGYDYMGKYLLAFTFREDGYSRLLNKRWGFFPGVSAGWVVSSEDFWKNTPGLGFVNYAKLRGSYGSNAIINRDRLGYYTLRGSYGAYQYDGEKGYRISALPNPNLSWETATTGEVGLDLGFLQNRFNLSLVYYNRTTSDKYAPLSLPPTTGFSSVTYNNGKYRNQGLEIDVNATLLRLKDFQWTLGANLTLNDNKIVKLPENGLANNRQGGVEVWTGNGEETTWIGGYQEGQNPYKQVGYGVVKMARTQADIDALGDYIDIAPSNGAVVYANESGRQRLVALGYSASNMVRLMPGDLIYEDRNGDNKIESEDRKVIGHRDARWSGGFNTTLSWKGLSLYARFDMGWGFQVYDSNMAFWLGEGQGAMAFPKEIRDTWTVDNPNAKYPRVAWAAQYGTDNYIRPNEMMCQNGAYLACRELSLSYQLPASICKKFASQGLTLSVTGQNLGYLKSCTIPLPDNTTYWNGNTAGNGGTYNLPRTVVFGVNVSF
ncbi:SusC/RagA family TonB-linked outer membrane protein [Paramuribaculum intestinale]|uniref:SusC/RagA family TonB-linked outer membrane protein n=1 Tax=Paramuribaculum intestinale TaxID=2094151 RepID=UPI0025B687FB|nr:TonB-dependent receptor [Paramuribaculum intestinale]